MNDLLTSQPLVIVTGAGASKWLDKATTYDIYDAPEFKNRQQLSLLSEFRNHVVRQTNQEAVDLEYLLDYLKDLNAKFDEVAAVREYAGHMNNLKEQRKQFGEVFESTLDFMVDYYGNVDEDRALALYEPLFDGVRDVLAGVGSRREVISIFTLNYDEAVESAVDRMPRYELRDGFGAGHRRYWDARNFDEISPNPGHLSVALFKLHGSVSWTRRAGVVGRIEKTPDVPRRREGRDHVVLYPTKEPKPIDEEPFSTAYGYLAAALAKSRVGVFIGTSFRDAELLDTIRRTFKKSSRFSVLAVGPECKTKAVAQKLEVPQARVVGVPLTFEPDTIPKILNRIDDQLEKAPPRRMRQKQ